MKNRFYSYIALCIILFFSENLKAQMVEVRANYNNVGDVDFVAYNNSGSLLFLNIEFADLENAVFNEPLPYIKLLHPGFNILFSLQREPGAGVPRFNYQIKTFRSNPFTFADLDFPYLIPLKPGEESTVFEVNSLDGFHGSNEPVSWNATGITAKPGQQIYSARTGIVVEIVGTQRTNDPLIWYHTWKNTITMLQPDGTLICYRNVIDIDNKLKPGQRVPAGLPIGVVAPDASGIMLVIFQHTLSPDVLRFIIPQFVTGEDETGVLLTSQQYTVVHPVIIKGIELTKKEKRQLLR